MFLQLYTKALIKTGGLLKKYDKVSPWICYCINKGWYKYADKLQAYLNKILCQCDMLLEVPCVPFNKKWIERNIERERSLWLNYSETAGLALKGKENINLRTIRTLVSESIRHECRYKVLCDSLGKESK